MNLNTKYIKTETVFLRRKNEMITCSRIDKRYDYMRVSVKIDKIIQTNGKLP